MKHKKNKDREVFSFYKDRNNNELVIVYESAKSLAGRLDKDYERVSCVNKCDKGLLSFLSEENKFYMPFHPTLSLDARLDLGDELLKLESNRCTAKESYEAVKLKVEVCNKSC